MAQVRGWGGSHQAPSSLKGGGVAPPQVVTGILNDITLVVSLRSGSTKTSNINCKRKMLSGWRDSELNVILISLYTRMEKRQMGLGFTEKTKRRKIVEERSGGNV